MQILRLNKITFAICFAIWGKATGAAELTNFDADQQIRQQQSTEVLDKQLQPEPSVQTGLEKQLQVQPQLHYLQSNSEEVCFNRGCK